MGFTLVSRGRNLFISGKFIRYDHSIYIRISRAVFTGLQNGLYINKAMESSKPQRTRSLETLSYNTKNVEFRSGKSTEPIPTSGGGPQRLLHIFHNELIPRFCTALTRDATGIDWL